MFAPFCKLRSGRKLPSSTAAKRGGGYSGGLLEPNRLRTNWLDHGATSTLKILSGMRWCQRLLGTAVEHPIHLQSGPRGDNLSSLSPQLPLRRLPTQKLKARKKKRKKKQMENAVAAVLPKQRKQKTPRPHLKVQAFRFPKGNCFGLNNRDGSVSTKVEMVTAVTVLYLCCPLLEPNRRQNASRSVSA